MNESTDRIERSLHIQANAERVWTLISEPGWWVNDGAITEHRIERNGDTSIVHDPRHGAFRITTLALDAPTYASFGWGGGADEKDDLRSGPNNVIEFWIEEQSDGGVLLRVVESGFDSIDGSERERRQGFEDSSQGWDIELAAARTFLGGNGNATDTGSHR